MFAEPDPSLNALSGIPLETLERVQTDVPFKAVLINPYELGRQPFALAEPAAWLKRAGFEVACIDLSLQKLDPRTLDGARLVAVYVGMHTATRIAAAAIATALRQNPRVTVITAAMCQGNKLEKVRAEFPDRFFDVGICESHAVAFAAGQAKAGCRPIVDIYSTFLQRSYDQIFQEVSLQNLPVVFMLDRAGLTGPDGPTHHGSYDLGYLRLFPNLTVLAPGDEHDLVTMVEWALKQNGPVAIRYPKTTADNHPLPRSPLAMGGSETLVEGNDGLVIACGTLLGEALEAAATLREEGLELTVINARFVKPLDDRLKDRVEAAAWTLTIEENTLPTGFGSGVLELVCDAGIHHGPIRRLGLPDRFVEHGERSELLASLGLDATGIADACRQLAGRSPAPSIPHAAAHD